MSLDDPLQNAPAFPYGADFGTGANFAVRRRLAIDLGGFDERLGAGTLSHGGEDLEMFTRVILMGGTVLFEPKALVWHGHRDQGSELKKLMVGYGTGTTATFVAHLVRGHNRKLFRSYGRGLHKLVGRRQSGLEGDADNSLVRAELRGALVGPVAFASEAFLQRFSRR